MRLKFPFQIVLLFLSLTTFAQNIQLSDESEIVVMTMGSHQGEIYSAFGHSAFRIVDPINNIDWVYNYGVFDFNQKNFYYNFAKGKMVYQLGMSYYKPFRDFYVDQDRVVREQYLNLTLVEKQQFLDFLQKKHKPENREYYYNYVYDNCATKIRDVVEIIFPNHVVFDSTKANQGKTIRNLMHDYLSHQPWGKFMIDIGLGTQIDKEASSYDYMFLPDYVFDAFAGATISTGGIERPLVKKMEMISSPDEQQVASGWLNPMTFFILLFFVVGFLTHLNMKRGHRTRFVDGLLFGFAGMVGIWLTFLWMGTSHLSTWNFDLLWAIPFHFPVVFMLRIKKWKPRLAIYFKVIWIWYAVLLVLWAVLPEQINAALIPFTLLLLLRAFYISWDLKRKTLGSNGVA